MEIRKIKLHVCRTRTSDRHRHTQNHCPCCICLFDYYNVNSRCFPGVGGRKEAQLFLVFLASIKFVEWRLSTGGRTEETEGKKRGTQSRPPPEGCWM